MLSQFAVLTSQLQTLYDELLTKSVEMPRAGREERCTNCDGRWRSAVATSDQRSCFTPAPLLRCCSGLSLCWPSPVSARGPPGCTLPWRYFSPCPARTTPRRRCASSPWWSWRRRSVRPSPRFWPTRSCASTAPRSCATRSTISMRRRCDWRVQPAGCSAAVAA